MDTNRITVTREEVEAKKAACRRLTERLTK